MANTKLTADVIAKIALPILENELGPIKHMYRAHEEEFSSTVNGYKVGERIQIRRPADFVIRRGATRSVQDVIEGKTDLVIDQQTGVDFSFTSADLTLKVEDMAERIIKPAMSVIANDMLADVLTQMATNAYHYVGTPGQPVNSFADFAKAPERLDEAGAMQESRCAIMNPADYWALTGSQTSLYSPGLVNSAYRSGELGNIGTVSTMMSQVLPTITTGARGGTPLVNGANQNVTYDTAKNTWTQTLNVDGASNSITGWAKAGDVFTIAGVFMVNPKTKANTGILQQFVVTADAASSGTGTLALTISPPIISSGPHQTVNAVPADNAAVTMLGTAATGYRQNLAFHKNAMALAVVPMEMPEAAYGGSRQSYKGLSVRIIPTYDGATDTSSWRMDLLYGRRLIDPRVVTRFAGTA